MGMPILSVIVMQMTPMVAAVPNAVPVRAEIRQQSRKVAKTIADWLQNPVA